MRLLTWCAVWKAAAPAPGRPRGDHRAYCDCCLAHGASRARRFRLAGSRRAHL